MHRKQVGSLVTVGKSRKAYKAYIPKSLPPTPPVQWSEALLTQQQNALFALGRLEGVSTLLPDTSLFLYSYIRKEAVLSSQIEGTQSSLADLLTYESEQVPGVPLNDVVEVSNYVAAMEHGLLRLRDGFPLSLRLIKEVHHRLLGRGRGSTLQPGAFRTSQNWIGGTNPGNAAFVPPPPDQVMPCLDALEKFVHGSPVRTSALVKAALTHVQFETIHPFLDGNGRVGRLLITLILCSEGLLSQPLLYLSLFFKQHRQQYYELLQHVRMQGDWEAWLAFFFDGVMVTANGAVSTAQRLLKLFAEDREQIHDLDRRVGSVLQVHHAFQRRPLLTSRQIVNAEFLTPATVNKALANLIDLGIVRETTGGQRGRLYAYDQYLKILQEE
jgi:Fic family protein